MSLAALPIELIDAICHNVPHHGLAALARVNSSVHPIAQRLLYRHVSISRAAHNLNVVITLARRPDVARHVRTFSLIVDDDNILFSSFYHALGKALSSMSELTSLELLVNPATSFVLTQSLRRPIYSRLHRFTSSFPFDTHVADFLARTPALEELELDSTPVPTTTPLPLLPPTSIPHLIHFVGSCQAATVIVPGRPLESIHIHDGDLTEDDIACLAQSTGQVAVLGAITTALLVPLLRNLARHLPGLAYLRVMAPFHLDSKIPENSFYEQVADSLRLMPELVDFEFSGMRWGSWQTNEKENKPIWQAAPIDLDAAVDQRDDGFDFSTDFAFVY
ncbi:hypothetical protein DENSPDRAFT_830920 [Dentipellis sp. KUC8613]|nr:hypothetical protein DENSPDRAFT_830920 [Dentipellis sp. KUC8613]